jgi:hypothetical protein
MDNSNVFDYILSEEKRFKFEKVPIGDGWEWNFSEHIKRSTLMKNSQYEGGNLGDRPYKNIVRPILNVAYRAEGFDVKDIEPFVNSYTEYYKTFLVRKYHSPFARKYNLDTYIDDLVESYVDYGVALSKKVNNVAPEIVPVQRIAFCDQTDILGGPLCEKHSYGIDQLLAMKDKGWYADEIDRAILMAKSEKTNDQTTGDQKQKTPGKYIEVYELHGVLPEKWLWSPTMGLYSITSTYYKRQMQVVTFYTDQATKEKKGICLFKGPEKDSIYKAIIRDKIFGRCAGFGGIEELFEPQVWINYSAIQIKEMMDYAAMIILQTADKSFKTKNKTIDAVKGQIVVTAEGMPITQVGISPVNMAMFDRSTEEWKQLARTTGSANDSILGEKPSVGTPFKLQELVNVEGHGLHEWRKGRIATHIGEVYRDWILQSLVNEMNKGQEFLDNLSLEELNEIVDMVVTNEVNNQIKKKILNNGMVTPAEQQVMMETERAKFMKGGSKRFLKVLKDELKNIPVDVEVNVAGKQKDLSRMSDVLTNIF